MRYAVAADHAGFALKQTVLDLLTAGGHDAEDLGTQDPDTAVDYPDTALLVADALTSGRAERGVLVCGSGAGVAIAATKVPGIRAFVGHDTYTAHQAVEHDDGNVLCIGARVVGPALAADVVRAFMDARFSGEERHVRRLAKVQAIEARSLRG